MIGMLAATSAGTVALVLLVAFVGHVRHPGVLPRALSAHRTLPAPLVRPAAAAVALLEGAAGAAIGYALLTGEARALSLAAAGGAVLLGGHAAYVHHVVRTRPAVPCGCGGRDTPATGWVAGRAAALGLASAVGAAGAGAAAGLRGAQAAIAGLAAAAFAVALWSLPHALAAPERRSP